MGIEITIEHDFPFAPEFDYLLKVLSVNTKHEIKNSVNGLLIGSSPNATIQISKNFITNFTQKKFSFKDNLGPSGFVEHENGTPDYWATAFYLLSCAQEYNSTPDALGRFKFTESYQSAFNAASQNIVQICLDKMSAQLGITPYHEQTKFFLTHDIDIVYEAILQDGFYAVKHRRIDVLLKLLFHVAIGKPDWLNMDYIMNLESEYDVKSTFFWIVKKGKEMGVKKCRLYV